MTCPSCHQPVHASDAFCEACGTDLTATTGASASAGDGGLRESASGGPATTVVDRAADPDEPDVGAITCLACGGSVDADGFCTTCGAKARTPRDHWTETPAAWVGGVCDKGVTHARNEDAMALAATPTHPGRAVLVICDGVTTAPESDRASIAAARAACATLTGAADPDGSVPARLAAWKALLEGACADAHAEAVAVARRLGDPPEPPSCTFVAAVVVDDLACVAWCGDSRAYWLPDGAPGRQLGVDHSIGAELIAAGVPEVEAEADPGFHTITRWLGADSVDPTPEFASVALDAPGWVLVCSDGMWNYAAHAERLAGLLAEAGAGLTSAGGPTGPTALAESLAAWANAQGGRDNVTVALARVDPAPAGDEVARPVGG